MLKALLLGTLFTMTAAATDYNVGPGQAMTQIGQVPWYALQAGDTVYIHYQPTPYYEKFLISGRGTPTQWIRVLGVPGPNGELPIISGNNAVTSTNSHYRWQTPTGDAAIQWDGVIQVALRADESGVTPPLPGYIEIANLQVQDGYKTYSFIAENGAKAAYEGFAACIYARSVEHILIRNNIMTNCGQGFYNWTGGTAGVWWDGLQADTVLRGNYFYNNGQGNSWTEHQTYTESNGVTIEYNRYGPQRSGALGSQLKDRSAGTVIRYNYIEASPSGWMIDMVEPEGGWATLGSSPKYAQAFVYGNILFNKSVYDPSMIHWNEDHNMGLGRATLPNGRLYFYDNTVVTVANQSDMGSFSLFNETWGGYDCPSAQPGVIDVRNNILAVLPRTAGSAIPTMKLGYCSFEKFDLGKNWVSPGWTGSGGTITGSANMFVPTVNDPSFLNLANNDFHLLPGSSATGLGQALPAAIVTNSTGADQTPTLQYVYHNQATDRPSDGGAGSDLGAFDAGAPSGCTYAVSPTSDSYSAAGATTGTFSVTTGTTCPWSASTLTPWITVMANSGTGYGLATYSVAANTTTTTRSGSMTIAGTTVPITQAAGTATCSYSISPASASITAAAGTGSIAVTAGSGCAWTAVSNASWITISSGASGSGSGSAGFAATANTATSARTGTVTVAGQTFTVSQAAAAQTCTYSISPASASIASAAGSGSIAVTAASGCTWTATSNKAWLTISSGASGSGNGSTGYSVTANTGTAARTGTATIGGQTFTVTQAAPTATCTYSISAASASLTAAGGTGSVSVTAGTGCAWTAVSNSTWITVTGGASGSGNGSTAYSVAANTGTTSRSGSVIIGGQTFAVTQSAPSAPVCTYALSPATLTAAAAGGSLNVSMTAPAGCAWTVAPGATWISVTSGASGSGNGSIVLNVAANTAASRTATVTAASSSVAVTQSAGSSTGSAVTVRFQQGVGGYTSTLDRTISSMYATESWNGGVGVTDVAGNTLEFKNDSDYEARGLLRFAGLNIPAGATITSATLTVTFTSWATSPLVINGLYLATPWNGTARQAGLNWANRDASLVWTVPGAKGVGTDVIANKAFAFAALNGSGKQSRSVALDPAVVQSWINNPASNNGVVLAVAPQTSTTNYASAYSSEAGTASLRPVLTITYQ